MATIHGSKGATAKPVSSPETSSTVTIIHGAPTPPPKSEPARPKQRWLSTLLILAVIGGGIAVGYPWIKPYLVLKQPTPPPPPRITPVVTAKVERSDMDLYLSGLGTVTSFKTVTVRSRVDGEIMKVAYTEGQMVHAGDLLAEIDSRPYRVRLSEVEAQLARDKSTLKLALLDYDRYESLVSSRAITKQQLDAQEALVNQTQATIQVDESLIENVKLQLEYCEIKAPIDGRIGLRMVDLGNLVRANDTAGIAVITQLNPIAVVFTIPQDSISRVQQKMQADQQLTVEAYDREMKIKLATGKLAAIDNQVDAATGTVRLKAVFENEKGMLFPNQFVNCRLLVEKLPQAVVVLAAGVQHGPDSMFAYVVKPDSTVELRKVVVGPSEGDRIVIESGLEPGETVVVEGVDKLQTGSKVVERGSEAGRGGPA
jgi:multidrug efflux system membrane fusion protein